MTKILIIGEAYGEQEELTRRPFTGSAGQELRKMLKEAGLDPASISFTNVLNLRPEKNVLSTLCVDKLTATKALAALRESSPNLPWPNTYGYTAVAGSGKYLHPQYLPHLWRLLEELQRGWDLVMPLGNVALWAITGHTGISRARGYLAKPNLHCPAPFFPTFHPSAVLHNWALRSIVIADFIKARQCFQEGEKIGKEIWIEPGLEDIQEWFKKVLPEELLCIDIETAPKQRQITCVGFGTRTTGISIPFRDRRSPNHSYWPTPEEEICAWKLVRHGLSLSNKKVFQNGLYDIQWLWRFVGLYPRGEIHDTMLIHHALQPEMQKDLEFLGSIYTDAPAWKDMRKKAKLAVHSEKPDD